MGRTLPNPASTNFGLGIRRDGMSADLQALPVTAAASRARMSLDSALRA